MTDEEYLEAFEATWEASANLPPDARYMVRAALAAEWPQEEE